MLTSAPLVQAQAPAGADAAAAAPGDQEAQENLPITVRARRIEGQVDVETVAEGEVELTRGPVVIRADRIRYDHPRDLARATGNVLITQDGKRFSGPELELQTETYEGFFTRPEYYFELLGAGGQAERVDFLGQQQLEARRATWSSCTPDDEGEYAWLLSTDRVHLDLEKNEGVAEGAVLRFYDVPILAVPWLSFPLGDQRKSGWLPPTLNLDSKSGLEVAVPYYWNAAPNLDATLTPTLITKRGAGLDSEFRYLAPRDEGVVGLFALPEDRLTGSDRWALALDNRGRLPTGASYGIWSRRVSDDDYWKDFPRGIDVLTPRLLPTVARLDWQLGDWSMYARAQDWQVLQDPAAPIVAPYARAPQLGLRLNEGTWSGWRFHFETEVNRFEHPDAALMPDKVEGVRAHAVGAISRRFGEAGWHVTPQLSLNAASYALDQPMADGRRYASRVIPGLSVDSGWVFERDTEGFGRRYLQTLEPRLLYLYRPYRRQDQLPNFDSAPLDFNFQTIFADNAFSGIDRVADAHQLTAGATTRYVDELTGAEALRLGIVQRFLFRDQRITPGDGAPYTDSVSDVLVLGSTGLVPQWTIGGSLQYNANNRSVVRSIFGARYSPGPFRTVSANYRFTRELSEQIDLAWQWPLYRRAGGDARRSAGEGCRGSWYSVGRFNYSVGESRVVDSILGFEYDSGCWIGRLVASRTSTGQREATTRLLFQIEFVGLSRLGSNPLGVLRANIPGYQLLREETRRPTGIPVSYD